MAVTNGIASATVGPYHTAGTHIFYVRTEDNAGNWSDPVATTLTVYPAATNLTLTPTNGVGTVGDQTTFTATATDDQNYPVAGVTVKYAVSGSVTTSGSCPTDDNGQCTFTYTGPQLPGADQISAYADNNTSNQQDQGEPTATATMSWQLPSNTQGQVTGAGIAPNADGSGKIAFGFLATNNGSNTTGECVVVDPSTKTIIHCTDANVLVVNDNQAVIFGDAKINGVDTTYRIDVQGNSPGSDSFTIVTDTGYSAGGTVSAGTIRVQ